MPPTGNYNQPLPPSTTLSPANSTYYLIDQIMGTENLLLNQHHHHRTHVHPRHTHQQHHHQQQTHQLANICDLNCNSNIINDAWSNNNGNPGVNNNMGPTSPLSQRCVFIMSSPSRPNDSFIVSFF